MDEIVIWKEMSYNQELLLEEENNQLEELDDSFLEEKIFQEKDKCHEFNKANIFIFDSD